MSAPPHWHQPGHWTPMSFAWRCLGPCKLRGMVQRHIRCQRLEEVNIMNTREIMAVALEEAKAAFKRGECPIGAVMVKNGDIISRRKSRN
jgi:hypothetical protein